MPEEPNKPGTEEPNVNDAELQSIENKFDETEAESSEAVSDTPAKAPLQKKSRKKIVLIIVAILVVLGIGGSVAAYTMYTNPEKVVFDAVQNSIKAETAVIDGNVKVIDSKNDGSVSVDFTSQNNSPKLASSLEAKVKIDYKELKVDLQGAGMVSESGDYYFKINNAPTLLDKALETDYGKLYTDEPSVQPLVTKVKAFVKKIDGRWIKVEKSDISQFSKDYDKQQTCVEKTVKKFYEDKNQQQQVIDAYGDHRVIKVKTSDKVSQTINNQDSVAYDLSLDIKKGDEFVKALAKTDTFKALQKCSSETDVSNSKMTDKEMKEAQKEADKVKVTAWVSRWSHQLTRIEIQTSETSTKFDFGANVDHDKKPQLKDPSNPLRLKDLSKELEAIYTEAIGDSAASNLPAASRS